MHRFFLKDFTREGEKITVERSVYIEGCLPVHDHDFLEIFYVEKGKGYHILNDRRIELAEGDLVFLSYHSAHTLEAITDDFEWINVSFYPDFIDKSLINEYNTDAIIRLSIFKSMFADNSITATSIMIKDGKEEFETVFHEMEKEYISKKYGYVQIMKYYLLTVMTKIFRDSYNADPKKDDLTNGKLINMVIEELDNNLQGEVNLDAFAKKVYMSPKYFSRVFKENVGITFIEFIHKKRIEKACQLLGETNDSISDIMMQVGYVDAKSFYKVFRRYMQMTPNQYRKIFKH